MTLFCHVLVCMSCWRFYLFNVRVCVVSRVQRSETLVTRNDFDGMV